MMNGNGGNWELGMPVLILQPKEGQLLCQVLYCGG